MEKKATTGTTVPGSEYLQISDIGEAADNLRDRAAQLILIKSDIFDINEVADPRRDRALQLLK